MGSWLAMLLIWPLRPFLKNIFENKHRKIRVGVQIIPGRLQEQNNIWSLHFIHYSSRPYLSPVGHQWGDLTLDWQVCSVLQAVLERNKFREKKKKKQNEKSDCLMKAQRDGSWEKLLSILDTAVLRLQLVIRVQRQRIRASLFPNMTSDYPSDP